MRKKKKKKETALQEYHSLCTSHRANGYLSASSKMDFWAVAKINTLQDNFLYCSKNQHTTRLIFCTATKINILQDLTSPPLPKSTHYNSTRLIFCTSAKLNKLQDWFSAPQPNSTYSKFCFCTPAQISILLTGCSATVLHPHHSPHTERDEHLSQTEQFYEYEVSNPTTTTTNQYQLNNNNKQIKTKTHTQKSTKVWLFKPLQNKIPL